MQTTLAALFEEPMSTEMASELLGARATQLSKRVIRTIFPEELDADSYYGAVFSITLPYGEAQSRLTSNILESTGQGMEYLGEDGTTRVYYKLMPGQSAPRLLAAPAAGKRRKTFKKKRLMSRKYCKKTPCRKMGFTQRSSCRPYKKCSKPSS
jgi:hypothetical protein